MKYDHVQIEKKWQNFWKKNKSFKAIEDPICPKYYVLDMFPYPSGAGLHVGHLVGYTATDIMARYKRQRGYNVLHPMGWDSFGLPAEQYALRTGTHPAVTTHTNIKKFKEQLESVGYAYDWEREISTCEPSYYKWTQWIFLKLHERGLAYQAELSVNYCPALGTVLANEEVEGGYSKEGGYPVERRPLRQWVLKITAYADRLLADLDLLDWPESLKKLQRNWIGRSEGALITFIETESREKIDIFTTAHDTLFGVTFLVLSPEHPLVDKITIASEKQRVAHYRQSAAAKSDLERSELDEKTGVFTGAYAINPLNGHKVPIWIADYVLMGYGTGAVMGVPAHDERDFLFAKKYGLPIQVVISPHDEEKRHKVFAHEMCWPGALGGQYVHSSFGNLSLDGLIVEEGLGKLRIVGWLEQQGMGKPMVSYRLRDWLFSRQRYWGEPFPIVHFADGTYRCLEVDELPLFLPEVSEFKPSPTGESPLARIKDWVEIIDAKTGQQGWRETNTMPNWAGSCWYYLRFLDPHNDKEPWSSAKEKFWMPVDLYVGGAEHAVLHLLYARFWHKVLYDCGLVTTKEPFQKLLNQGLVVARSYQKKDGCYVDPAMVIEKEGSYYHWETHEELRSQIEKMSKSKLNGVSPDDMKEEFGADSMRLYAMFMGPIEKEKVWNTNAVSGCKRFLNRFFDLCTSGKVTDSEDKESLKLAHRLVNGVTSDIESMLFNTAISKMMEFVSDMLPLPSFSKQAVLMAIKVLAPFAPHLAEEMWAHLGQKGSVAHASWPEAESIYLIDEMVTYVIQVNGKMRGRFELPKDQEEEKMITLAKEHPHISKYLLGTIQKVIFIPNKLLNFVIE